MKRRLFSAVSVVLCLAMSACSLWVQEERVTEPEKYEEYFGGLGLHRRDALIDSAIFPEKLPASARVERFSYHRYDPWDPNFTNLLVFTCDEDELQREKERLSRIASSEELTYGARGFPLPLCAVNCDEYGIVYAMEDAGHQRLIYVEITFCNFFSDMDYTKEIGSGYLPTGFNAAPENPTRKRFEESDRAFPGAETGAEEKRLKKEVVLC